jgi:putative membrane protein
MTHTIRTVVTYLVRFAILWFVDALSLLLTSWVLPGLNLTRVGDTSVLTVAIAAAFLLTIVNLLIRPIVFLLAKPLGWVALFVIGFLVNAVALWITAYLMPGFEVDFLSSIVGGVVFAFFNAIMTGILDVDDEGSFYQNRIEKRAKEQP